MGAIIPDGIRGRGLLRTILDHKLFVGGRSTYIQGNDFITVMSGSLGYMDLKSEIDGIDKSSSSIFEFKFATKLVKSGESMPLYIVHLLHCCAAARFLP